MPATGSPSSSACSNSRGSFWTYAPCELEEEQGDAFGVLLVAGLSKPERSWRQRALQRVKIFESQSESIAQFLDGLSGIIHCLLHLSQTPECSSRTSSTRFCRGGSSRAHMPLAPARERVPAYCFQYQCSKSPCSMLLYRIPSVV